VDEIKDAGIAAASEPPYAEHLAGWPGDWHFATPEDTERRPARRRLHGRLVLAQPARRRPGRPRRLSARDLPGLVPRPAAEELRDPFLASALARLPDPLDDPLRAAQPPRAPRPHDDARAF
jgi:hypothetical protein